MGRVWPRHGHRGRPFNTIVRRHSQMPVIGLFIVLVCLWLVRSTILVRRLRDRHSSFYFAQLGAPTLSQLAPPAVSRPRLRLQWRLQRFIWTGEFFRLRDAVISSTVVVTVICEIGALLGILVLIGERME